MSDDANAQRTTAPRRWIGAVPPHWQVVQLKLVARLESGHTPSRQVPKYWENCTIPWFSLADVWQLREEGRKYVYETAEMVSELGIANSSARLLPAGTVMLSRTASVGFTGIMGREMATTQDFVNWVCGPRLKADYLWYCLQAMTPEFERLRFGSTHQTIYMPDVAQFKVPVPPLSEQERIANFLDEQTARIDALIAEKERLLAALSDASFELLHHAVTKGLRDYRMKPSGREWVGEIPEHWTAPYIRFVAKLESGHTPSRQVPKYWENCTTPWFSLSDVWQIRDGVREVVTETAEKISELGLANSAARLLPAGTVMLSRTASVGYSAIMGVPMATTQDFANWLCGPKILPEFLLYVLRSMREEFSALKFGSTHATIYMPDLARLSTPLPPIEEQREIVQVARARKRRLDELRSVAGVALDRLREYRSSLISAAVTGQLDIDAYRAHAPEALEVA